MKITAEKLKDLGYSMSPVFYESSPPNPLELKAVQFHAEYPVCEAHQIIYNHIRDQFVDLSSATLYDITDSLMVKLHAATIIGAME